MPKIPNSLTSRLYNIAPRFDVSKLPEDLKLYFASQFMINALGTQNLLDYLPNAAADNPMQSLGNGEGLFDYTMKGLHALTRLDVKLMLKDTAAPKTETITVRLLILYPDARGLQQIGRSVITYTTIQNQMVCVTIPTWTGYVIIPEGAILRVGVLIADVTTVTAFATTAIGQNSMVTGDLLPLADTGLVGLQNSRLP